MGQNQAVDTVISLLRETIQRLTVAACDTPRLDAELLLAYTLNKDRSWLYRYPDYALKAEQITSFLSLLKRRVQREPMAYIVESKGFFGLDFWVNRHVLIPRPETELLIETALVKTNAILNKRVDNIKKLSIVDVGTGSACIAVSLAKYVPQATLTAVDISAPALLVAQHNAKQHGLSQQIAFLQGDLLSPLAEPADMIVSNPPYVSRSALALTMPEVNQYEPTAALDGGPDGLDIIQRLLKQAVELLQPTGCLLIEIGFDQGQAILDLAKIYFPQADMHVKKDLAGLDRLLVLCKQSVCKQSLQT